MSLFGKCSVREILRLPTRIILKIRYTPMIFNDKNQFTKNCENGFLKNFWVKIPLIKSMKDKIWEIMSFGFKIFFY